jgi:7-cyano-7-deazaguanine synthase in queuosine biosynthesis
VAYSPKKLVQHGYSFDFTDATVVEWIATDVSGDSQNQRFILADEHISDSLHRVVPAIYADVVDVAAAIHFADRLSIRGPGNHGWARELKLRVPVRCLDQWLSARLRDALFSALSFLTQDHWQLEFCQRVNPGRSSETQEHLFTGQGDEECEVCLYSGGLDSFAGLAAAVSRKPDSRFLCVSVTGNSRQRQRQREQLALLQRTFQTKVTHIPVEYRLVKAEQGRQERTRRTRGLLFLLIGGVAALIAGRSQLKIFENGIGAINLPFDGSQIGIDNSRSVNPITLSLVSQILTLIAAKPFSIQNECIYLTKAEMCRDNGVKKAAVGIRSTFSCDGFPVRRRQYAQCGFCTSCVLRRQALEASAMSVYDSDDYGCDLTTDRPFLAHHLRGLRAMNIQRVRLEEAFRSSDPWTALTFAFPELRRVGDALSVGENSGEVRARLIHLYQQHVNDWRSFSAAKNLESQPMLNVA